METVNHSFPWLELIERPAFCVKDGIIIAANSSAEQYQLQAGTDIRELLTQFKDAYEAFEGGQLHLTVTVCGLSLPASVARTAEYDIFQIFQEDVDAGLQALSLAAIQLRTPLANVLTVTDRLFSKMEHLDTDAQKQVGQINQNLYRLLRIISNMSDAGNCQKNITGMQVADLSAVIGDAMEKADTLFAATGIQIQYNGLQTPVYSLANTEKLERAIYNLLSNAAKFSKAGSTVNVTLTKSGNQLTFSVYSTVADSFSEDSLWKRYLREPAVEDPRHGLGLGMTLVTAAAALHGGTVLVDHPSSDQIRVSMTIPIVKDTSGNLRSPTIPIGDYAGGRDMGLLELSDVLPSDTYNTIN